MRDRLYFNEDLAEGVSGEPARWNMTKLDRARSVAEPSANLISSMAREDNWLGEGVHLPTLDIDLPCQLRESSPGHFHLYIDKPMSWSSYRMLLDVLASVGIIERGYADASINKGASCLRKPGTFKDATILRGEHTYNPETHALVPRALVDALGAVAGQLDAAFEPLPDVTVPKSALEGSPCFP